MFIICVVSLTCVFLFSDQNESHPILSASNLLKRRHIFHLNLVSIVKQHHKVSICNVLTSSWFPIVEVTVSCNQQMESGLKVNHTNIRSSMFQHPFCNLPIYNSHIPVHDISSIANQIKLQHFCSLMKIVFDHKFTRKGFLSVYLPGRLIQPF